MQKSLIAGAMCVAALAGCSSAPSDEDIKQVVESMLGGCPVLSLEKFKKVNGVAAGKDRYTAEVVFTVKVSPVPGASELVAASNAEVSAIEQKMAIAKASMAEIESKERGFDDRINAATQAGDRAASSSLTEEKINYLNSAGKPDRDLEALQRQKKAIESKIVSAIDEKVKCPNVHDLVRVYEAGNLQQYTTAFTKDFSGLIPLIKTESGWRTFR